MTLNDRKNIFLKIWRPRDSIWSVISFLLLKFNSLPSLTLKDLDCNFVRYLIPGALLKRIISLFEKISQCGQIWHQMTLRDLKAKFDLKWLYVSSRPNLTSNDHSWPQRQIWKIFSYQKNHFKHFFLINFWTHSRDSPADVTKLKHKPRKFHSSRF